MTHQNEPDTRFGCAWCATARSYLQGGLCSRCARIKSQQRRYLKLVDDPVRVQELQHHRIKLEYYRELECLQRFVGKRQAAFLDDPQAISLEYLFEQVAQQAGCPWKTFHGAVDIFSQFDPDQRRNLVRLLLDVVRIGGGPQQRYRAWADAVKKVIVGR